MQHNQKSHQTGFTLIEIMIVVVVIAIIAAIAMPSYQQYTRGAKRAVATAELLEALSLQEQYILNNKQYAGALTGLGYAANPYYLSSEGEDTATAATAIYEIKLTTTGTPPSAFSLEAVPKNSQAADSCGTLTLNHLGVRAAGGSVADCW